MQCSCLKTSVLLCLLFTGGHVFTQLNDLQLLGIYSEVAPYHYSRSSGACLGSWDVWAYREGDSIRTDKRWYTVFNEKGLPVKTYDSTGVMRYLIDYEDTLIVKIEKFTTSGEPANFYEADYDGRNRISELRYYIHTVYDDTTHVWTKTYTYSEQKENIDTVWVVDEMDSRTVVRQFTTNGELGMYTIFDKTGARVQSAVLFTENARRRNPVQVDKKFSNGKSQNLLLEFDSQGRIIKVTTTDERGTTEDIYRYTPEGHIAMWEVRKGGKLAKRNYFNYAYQ
jgi:hypothetical protein